MAGLRLEIRIDDKGTAVIKRVEGAHGTLERKVKSQSARMGKAVDALRRKYDRLKSGIGRMAQFAKIALAGLAIATILVGAKFEQSMANVAAVSSATEEELRKLTATARGLGATTAFSASQAAEAMLALAQAGQTVVQIQKTVGSVLLFAGAAATDLGSAAETLVQTLAQFGLKASQANRVVNVFAASLSVSLLNAERLREGLSAVGATASAMGLRLEETVAVLGLLNSAGNLGGIAGTRLKNVLTRLAAPNQVLKDLLKGVSLQVDGLSASMLAMIDADPGAIFKAFGRIGGPAVLIMRRTTEEMARLEKAITATNKAQEMFDVQMNTVASQFKIFKSQLQENMIAVFTAARDTGFNVLTDLTRLLKDIKPVLVAATAAGIEFVGWIRDTVRENAGAIKTFVAFATILSVIVFRSVLVAKAMALVKGAMLLVTGPIGLIIGGAALATFVWIKWGDDIKAMVRKVGTSFADGFRQIRDIFTTWATFTKETVGVAKAHFDEFVDDLQDVATRIWDAIKWPFVKLAELAKKAAGVFKRVFPGAAASVEAMLDVLKDKGGAAADFVADKGRVVAGAVGGAASDAVTAVGTGASAVAGAVGAATDAAKKKLDELRKKANEMQAHLKSLAAKGGAIAAPGTPGAGGETAAEEKSAREAAQRAIERAQAEIRAAEKAEDKRRSLLVETLGREQARTEEWLAARLELIRSNFNEESAAAGANLERQAELRIEFDLAVAEARMEHEDAILEHFLVNNEIQLLAIDSLGAAYDSWVDDAIAGELHLKKTRERMWQSFRASFLAGVAAMIRAELKQRLVGLLIARTAKDADASKDKLIGAKAGAVKAYSAFASIPFVGPVLGAAAAAAAFAFLIAFQRGGRVPGISQGRDSVVGVLEPQEFVVRRAAARSIGTEALEHINRTGTLPATAARGGDVNLFVDAGGAPTDVLTEITEYLEDTVMPEIEDIKGRRRGLRDRRNVA